MTHTIIRLKKRADFVSIASQRQKFILKNMVIQYKQRTDDAIDDTVRFGITVTKKQGSAVTRNRIKRRLKAAISQELNKLCKPQFDYVFIPKHDYASCPFEQIITDLRFAFRHIHRSKTPTSHEQG